MKRRVDEPDSSNLRKFSESIAGFSRVQITHPASSVSGTAVVSPYQGPTEVKLEGGMQSSVQQFPSYSAMPTATAQTATGLATLHSLARVDKQRVPVSLGGQTIVSGPAAALSQVGGANQQFQRLKVEDALSYLDQVKFKFGNMPHVYNNFLDIMKEFKSQSIDTPGVIERVSNLFKGHPQLIVGFNTFLPPGYKIEVHPADGQVSVMAPGQATTTVVHTPTGILTHNIPATTQHAPVTTASTTTQSTAPKQPTIHSLSTNVSQSAVSLNAGQHSYHQQPPAVPTSTSPRPGAPSPLPQTQPVEFNHAINYVNKIKNRFQGQPDVYKQFLDILHTYQKEQRCAKEGGAVQVQDTSTGHKTLSEAEVYSQVAKLFSSQTDLLQEFGQFLPDATNAANGGNSFLLNFPTTKGLSNDHTAAAKKPPNLKLNLPTNNSTNNTQPNNKINNAMKRPPPTPPPTAVPPPPPPKRPRMGTLKDVTLAEAGKYGTLNEFAFFDKVRKALRGGTVYDNFLRCIHIYNQELISRTELVQILTPFLVKFPELLRWFKDFVGIREGVPVEGGTDASTTTVTPQGAPSPVPHQAQIPPSNWPINEPIPNNIAKQGRVTGDLAMEIDYSTCKRLGASYCAFPKSYAQPKCSGRTPLCKEVLNDTWVSFPSWSEDSTFVSSRKTQYEEYIYRCEDERFELDVVIELNAATIRVLDAAQKKIQRMAPEDASKFRLDDSFGGSSSTLYQRAIRRIYGEKTQDIIEGLKKNPQLAIPIVLKRLRAKEEDWREAQKSFNKIWREQNEKYYLKSLDHQGINFKQNDIKNLRSKALINDIETLYDERHSQLESGTRGVGNLEGPHTWYDYRDRDVLDDAANLLIHHVKRQAGIHSEDKTKIKQLLRHTLPDLFMHPRQELSDDEEEEDDKVSSPIMNGDIMDEYTAYPGMPDDPDEQYSFFMTNSNWYVFLRLHQLLCERLTRIREQTIQLHKNELKENSHRNHSTATALRLRPKMCVGELEVSEYYSTFLDMVRNLLDGNMESGAYEDTLREMFGIHAYIAFTMDKIISNAVRQLQNLVSDDVSVDVTEAWKRNAKRGGGGGRCGTAHQRYIAEQNYQRQVETTLQDYTAFKVYIYKKASKISFEMVDSDSSDSSEETDHPNSGPDKWSAYVEQYVTSSNGDPEISRMLLHKPVPVFLIRNLKFWKEKKEKGSWDIKDNVASHFSRHSFRMSYVVNREANLYKKGCLTNARKCHRCVTTRLKSEFSSWHDQWVKNNVTDSAHKYCNDWMLGRLEGTSPNRTRVQQDNDINKPPYTPYNRYRVDKVEPS